MYEYCQHRSTDDGGSYRFSDIYAADEKEAAQISTAAYEAGSKLYIVRTGRLYLLDQRGGQWYSVDDATPMASW